jgi:hypothetical protein
MPKSLIPALFALVVAHDIRTQIKAREYREFAVEVFDKQEAHTAQLVEGYDEKLKSAGNQIEYLVGMLNENGIVPDEFDLIALNFNN